MMTPRQKRIVRMALAYMKSNIDDVRDSFASPSAFDPDNLDGFVRIGSVRMKSPAGKEVATLQRMFGEKE